MPYQIIQVTEFYNGAPNQYTAKEGDVINDIYMTNLEKPCYKRIDSGYSSKEDADAVRKKLLNPEHYIITEYF